MNNRRGLQRRVCVKGTTLVSVILAFALMILAVALLSQSVTMAEKLFARAQEAEDANETLKYGYYMDAPTAVLSALGGVTMTLYEVETFPAANAAAQVLETFAVTHPMTMKAVKSGDKTLYYLTEAPIV